MLLDFQMPKKNGLQVIEDYRNYLKEKKIYAEYLEKETQERLERLKNKQNNSDN
jgi:CheY-like chemotaxis protein